MLKHNLNWYSENDTCKRLGFAPGCIERLAPAKRHELTKLSLDGMYRADLALHTLAPDKQDILCGSCLKPLPKGKKGYCDSECRQRARSGRDMRTTVLEVPLCAEFEKRFVERCFQTDMAFNDCVRVALEYGSRFLLKYQRGVDDGP